MQRTIVRYLSPLLLVSTLTLGSAYAHKGATGITKERMDTMSNMGKSIGVLFDMLKGKISFNAAKAIDAARALQNHSDKVVDQYPDTANSKQNKFTQALPVVWTDRATFDELVSDLKREVSALNKVAAEKNFDMLRPQIAQVAKSCSACHEKFRKPK